MDPLRVQLKSLEAGLERLRQGDYRALNEIEALLPQLNKAAEGLERRQQELLTLYEIGREIASVVDPQRLMELILDRAVVLVGADRGFLVIWDAEKDDFEVVAARRFSSGEVEPSQLELSRALIRRVLTTREPVVTTNAQEDPRFQSSQSIIAYQIRSVLAAPMIAFDELIGAIYVDTRMRHRVYTSNDMALLKALADQAAVAIRMARLYNDLQRRNVELQKALEDLRAAQNELIRAERLSTVGRMASTIIHDLKNPMTVIKGFAELLGRTDLPPAQREQFSKTIVRTVDRFVGMTQEILDYARGETSLSCKEVTVAALLEDLRVFLENDLRDHGIELHIEMEYDGPVVLDEEKIGRVFFNLASNARDAMKDGGSFIIHTRRLNGWVEFRLVDTGPGIPPEIRDRLFEPFVTHGKKHGTGLGLAIVRRIVEAHEGTIEVESEPGHGATFIIRLPVNGPREEKMQVQ